MSKRTLAIGLSVLALVALALFFVLGRDRDGAAPEDTGTEGPDAAEQRRALVEKKRAARQQRKLELDTPRTVTGIVTRKTDGRGVPGAVVLLTRKSITQGATDEPGQSPAPLRVVTDDAGEFSLTTVSAGRYVISATAPGFLPAGRNDVRVLASDDQPRITLTLEPGGHPLRGTITDIGGGPIEDVLVSVNDMESGNLFGVRVAPPATLTDEEGHYEVNLPNGSYVLTTYHPDYVAAYRITQIMNGPRVEDLELAPGASIEGVVLARGSDEPVADAIVTFQDGRNGNTGGFRMNISADGRMVRTDERGRFQLDGVHPGVAQVEARARGFGSRQTLAVPVGIGESVTGIELVLDPAYTLSGFVVPKGDPDGAVEGVMVGAYSISPPSLTVAAVPTDEDGYFEILGVLPGNYTVGAIGEDVLPNISGTAAVVHDHDLTDLLVEMDVGLWIRGRVDPPAPAKISLSIDTDQMSLGKILDAIAVAFARTTARPDGQFELGPVKDGTYQLVAEAPDGEHGELEVTVTGADLEGVTVAMEPRASVAGVVVDEAGAPQPGMTVRLKKVEGGSVNFAVAMRGPFGDGGVPTGEDGSFVARGLDAGRYSVVVRDKKARPIPWADDGESADPSPMVVEVADGEHQTGVQLRIQSRTGTLAGRVVDAQGAPVADAWVTASLQVDAEEFGAMMTGPKVPAPGERERRRGVKPPKGGADDFELPAFFAEPPVLTDELGQFTITQLRSSRRYNVVAEGERGGARGRIEDLRPDRRDLVVALEPVAGISGVVTAGGTTVEQYTVELTGPSKRQKSVFSTDGKFQIERIEPGEYTVSVTAKQGVARLDSIEVKAEQVTTVPIELEDYGEIEGTLVSASSGEPISGMVVLVQPDKGRGDASQALAMMMGGGTKTGSDGEFVATKVAPGTGKVLLLDPAVAFSGGGGFVAAQEYEIDPGEHLDLGTINGIVSKPLEEDERGSFGLGVTVATYAKRVRPPGAKLDGEDGEDGGDDDSSAGGDPIDADSTPRLWVSYVEIGGPAAEEGVEPGDEVLSVDGQSVSLLGPHAASILIEGAGVKTGESLTLELSREGSSRTATVRAEPKTPAKAEG